MGLSDPDRLRDSLHGSVYQSREILESPQGSGASCAGVGPGFCGLSGVHWSEARWGRAYWGHGQRWDSVYRSVEWRSVRRDCRGGTWCLLGLRWGITEERSVATMGRWMRFAVGEVRCVAVGCVRDATQWCAIQQVQCDVCDSGGSSSWGWYIRRVTRRDLVPRTLDCRRPPPSVDT